MGEAIHLDLTPSEYLAILRSIPARLRELAKSEAKDASREEDELETLERRLLSQRTKAIAC